MAPGSTISTPPRSLDQQIVLDEDEYTAALSQIIARDFFPSLAHLDATNDYLDALETRDPHLINASVRRIEQLSTPATRARPWQTPSETPYGAGPSETPLRTPSGQPPAKRPRYDTDMSLDTFQARYTSEDNSSFTQILAVENKRRQEKYSWAWDAQRRVEAQRERMLEGRERALIEAPQAPGVREKLRIEVPVPTGLITAGGEESERNELDEDSKEKGSTVDGRGKEVTVCEKQEEVLDVMAPKKDTRPAGVDGWKFKARNTLMFPPDADVAPYDPSKPSAKAADKGEPKLIVYGNTRLSEQEESTSATHGLSAPASPTRSRIDAAIAGTPCTCIHSERLSCRLNILPDRSTSPRVNDFSYVPAIPSPTPSELGPAAVKQLMTWGTLNATPRILSQTDDPADASMPPPSTPFHISAPSARETLSHKLSSSAAKSLRVKANLLNSARSRRTSAPSGSGQKSGMAPPSWTPRRADAAGSLTPAAKRLLDRTTMGTAATRRAEAMGRMSGWEGRGKEKDMNRVRWTPTPSPVTRRSG